jgi:hypothetical protein
MVQACQQQICGRLHGKIAAPLGRYARGRLARCHYRRDVGDGEHAEFAIDMRVYRVRTSELG